MLFTANLALPELLFDSCFVFDSTKKETTFYVHLNSVSDSVYFFLLEIDSEKSSKSISKEVQTNPDLLIYAHKNIDFKTIRLLLEDDDIISARKLELPKTPAHSISFQEVGFHLFDKYSYTAVISAL